MARAKEKTNFKEILVAVQTNPVDEFTIDNIRKDISSDISTSSIETLLRKFAEMGWTTTIGRASKKWKKEIKYLKNKIIYDITPKNFFSSTNIDPNYLLAKGLLEQANQEVNHEELILLFSYNKIPYYEIKPIIDFLIKGKLLVEKGLKGYKKNKKFINHCSKIGKDKDKGEEMDKDKVDKVDKVEDDQHELIQFKDYRNIKGPDILSGMKELNMENGGSCLFAYITHVDKHIISIEKELERLKTQNSELKEQDKIHTRYIENIDGKLKDISNYGRLQNKNLKLNRDNEKLNRENGIIIKKNKELEDKIKSITKKTTVMKDFSQLISHKRMFE